MLIVLVGASGTGKSTIEKEIQKLGYDRIVSWTTRNPRPGELHGQDYYFTTNDDFIADINEFAEYEKYSQGRFYGTLRLQYSEDRNQVAVLTPHGVRLLRKNLPNLPIFVVYMEASLKERVMRYINRCGDFTLTDMTELSERVQRDFGMFCGLQDEADLVITNNGDEEPIKIAKRIVGRAASWKRSRISNSVRT